MSVTVRRIEIPPDSEICRHLSGVYFFDSYEGPLKAEDACTSALDLSLQTFLEAPAWVDFLMQLRNRVVGLAGLKNLGSFNDFDRHKPASDYRVGDRLGIFSLRYLTENEVILGDSDKHLDVLVSVSRLMRGKLPFVTVSTVVHVHNWLGRFYMLFVAPAHKVIAPATLRSRLLRGGANADL